MILIHSIRTGRSSLLQTGDPNRSPIPFGFYRRLGGGPADALPGLCGLPGGRRWLSRGRAAVTAGSAGELCGGDFR